MNQDKLSSASSQHILGRKGVQDNSVSIPFSHPRDKDESNRTSTTPCLDIFNEEG